MGACAELNVLPPERREFTVAETCLNGEEEKRSVAPSDPCAEIGGCYKRGALFLVGSAVQVLVR
jgi:hypothetical protein